MPEFEKREMYLGDGVYASYDGYHIVLDLRGQKMPGHPLTQIALDPEVLDTFDHFREIIKKLKTKEDNNVSPN